MEWKRLHEIHGIVVERIERLIEKGGGDAFLVEIEGRKKGWIAVRGLCTVLRRVQQNLAALRQNDDIFPLTAEHDAIGYVVELCIRGCEKSVFGDEERDGGLRIGVDCEELYGAVEEAWE